MCYSIDSKANDTVIVFGETRNTRISLYLIAQALGVGQYAIRPAVVSITNGKAILQR